MRRFRGAQAKRIGSRAPGRYELLCPDALRKGRPTRRLPIELCATTLNVARIAVLLIDASHTRNPRDPNVTDFEIKEKDLEKAAEKLAAWDLSGAVTELVGVLATVTGGPLAGALAKGTASSILRGVAKNATLRMLEEGARIDDEREQRRLLAQHLHEGLRGCFTDELQPLVERLDSMAAEQREYHLRQLRFTDASLSELRDMLLRELKQSGPSDAELVSAFKRQHAIVHGKLVLHGLFPGESPLELNQVFVDLGITDYERGVLSEHKDRGASSEHRDRGAIGQRVTLKQLMQLGSTEQHAPRWVVLGDPGAGKSTLARHLAWELARDNQPEAPLALYASLPRLALEHLDPFALAEQELSNGGGVRGQGLAVALQRLGKSKDRVWLLLDGLDEISYDHREWVWARLVDWATEYPQVAVAVFSRRVGYEPIGSPYDRLAKVEPLDHPTQIQLLCGWGIERPRAETIPRRIVLGTTRGLSVAADGHVAGLFRDACPEPGPSSEPAPIARA